VTPTLTRPARARTLLAAGPEITAPGVRQNLSPLVVGGKPTAESASWRQWGATLGHMEFVARLALGENAAGELMYAASMSAAPADLAEALARDGVPGQHRPATQYLTGWTRDFIAVLAPPPSASASG
jgi:hypothetical protein